MMDKLLLFPGKTDQGVFTYIVDAEKNYLEKTAAQYHPTIGSYIHAAKPIPGKTQILLTALGAGEYYGANVNGDFFPEKSLAYEGKDYGYKTFEYYAKAYKHHINKDPSAAYGDVLLSVYNPTYRRVELIVGIDNKRAPDIVSRVENGDYPEWSMGCLKGDARVLMSDYTYRPICELTSGDKIVNASGGVSEVDYPHHHAHKGRWYEVSALGVNDIEPTTEEHPWLVIPAGQVECSGNPKNKSRRINKCFPNREHKLGCQDCPNAVEAYKKVWKRADELSEGDYIATPVYRPKEQRRGMGYAKEYLLGLYMAQGHISKDNYIHLSVHIDHKHLYDKLVDLFPDVSVKWNAKEELNSATISLYNKGLAGVCLEHVGKYAHAKHISEEIMCWNQESQKNFLGGYHDGDGGVYKDCVYFSTCNEALSQQVASILLRLGCISSTNVIHHKPSTTVFKDTVEYQVWVGQDSAHTLSGFSEKGADLPPPRIFKNHRFIWDNKLWSPITTIDVQECDEEVYNIAVKSPVYDNDSYVVNGVALHNCRVPWDRCNICGNKAPTRAQYCDHARYYLGKIDPDTGKQVYVINDRPKFHDISQVLIGADRIAKTLQKVASAKQFFMGSAQLAEKMAGNKSAAITKKIPTSEPPASQETLDNLVNSIPEVKATEKSFPRETLDYLARYPLSTSMSTLSSLGILPKPQEFQRIFLIRMGQRPMADMLDRGNLCFSPDMVPTPEDAHNRALDVRPDHFEPRIMSNLRSFMPERSYSRPHLVKRLVIMVKNAENRDHELPYFIKTAKDVNAIDWDKLRTGSDKEERKPVSVLPMLLAAAGLYAALGNKAPDTATKGVDSLIAKNPGLAAALGVGLAATFGAMAGPSRRGKISQGEYVNPDVSDASAFMQRHSNKSMSKQALLGPSKSPGSAMAKRLFLGIPLAYMASGVLQKHRELSPYGQEGGVKSFFRRNPDLVSAALVGDAVLASRGKGSYGVLKKVTPKLKAIAGTFKMPKAAESSLKTAGAWETAGEAAKGFVIPLAMGGGNLPGRAITGVADQFLIKGIADWAANRSSQKQPQLNKAAGKI